MAIPEDFNFYDEFDNVEEIPVVTMSASSSFDISADQSSGNVPAPIVIPPSAIARNQVSLVGPPPIHLANKKVPSIAGSSMTSSTRHLLKMRLADNNKTPSSTSSSSSSLNNVNSGTTKTNSIMPTIVIAEIDTPAKDSEAKSCTTHLTESKDAYLPIGICHDTLELSKLLDLAQNCTPTTEPTNLVCHVTPVVSIVEESTSLLTTTTVVETPTLLSSNVHSNHRDDSFLDVQMEEQTTSSTINSKKRMRSDMMKISEIHAVPHQSDHVALDSSEMNEADDNDDDEDSSCRSMLQRMIDHADSIRSKLKIALNEKSIASSQRKVIRDVYNAEIIVIVEAAKRVERLSEEYENVGIRINSANSALLAVQNKIKISFAESAMSLVMRH